jgi:phage baseplate assembly protein W
MNPAFSLDFDPSGRTATADDSRHIRDLIEQVLFTAPGERVNRPTFGCGLLQLVFAPSSDALVAATQFLVQSSLQQWLGDVITIDAVEVESQDSRLRVLVRYAIRRTGVAQSAEFIREGSGP